MLKKNTACSNWVYGINIQELSFKNQFSKSKFQKSFSENGFYEIKSTNIMHYNNIHRLNFSETILFPQMDPGKLSQYISLQGYDFINKAFKVLSMTSIYMKEATCVLNWCELLLSSLCFAEAVIFRAKINKLHLLQWRYILQGCRLTQRFTTVSISALLNK